MASSIYRVRNCPIPSGKSDYHEGVDALLDVMGNQGVKLYQTEQTLPLGGREGLIARDDVVLVKVNAQWKYRGCTNSDVVRGLIRRILEHPDGFGGEVVLFENGQSAGSMDCDTMWGGSYPDTGVHANAEDERQSFTFLVEEVFRDPRVSKYVLDPVRETFISSDDHTTDGYRRWGKVSYPCFTTRKGSRVELREGIWDGTHHQQNLKLINVPVLKHHGGCGMTGALKSFYGVLSMADGRFEERHYAQVGQHCGEMIVHIKAPVINLLDCIWVTQVEWCGYPVENTTRLDELLASVDPVALDYWASKYLLYPIDANEEHHPDRFPGLRDTLLQAREVINAGGGLFGQQVTLEEQAIKVITRTL